MAQRQIVEIAVQQIQPLLLQRGHHLPDAHEIDAGCD